MLVKKFFMILVLVGCSIASAQSSHTVKWLVCNDCSEATKEVKAKANFSKNNSVRVNVFDIVNDRLTTYHVTSVFENELGAVSINRISARPVESTEQEVVAKDVVMELLRGQTHFQSTDLGVSYGNAGYLVNTVNARTVGERLSAAINSSMLAASRATFSTEVHAAFTAIPHPITFVVTFPDGSTASFVVNAIPVRLGTDGQFVRYDIELLMTKIKDADSNVMPTSFGQVSGIEVAPSTAALSAWETAFAILGIQYIPSSFVSTGYTISCRTTAGVLTCTSRPI
ncbi:MAG: hypothetical protein V2I33_07640 [Kangiellaceae bacterium]|jgi:hypothetical protein|nr:hypothetical protein [Kangiellaceae bacterium]